MSDHPIRLTEPPTGYADWLSGLKTRIQTAQQRATLAVNRELVLLYWQIGRDILTRQAEQGWGAKVIERLAGDLRLAFPDMKGFSPRNLKYMRAFCRGLAGRGTCAAGCCTIALGSQPGVAGPPPRPGNPALVCRPGHRAQLVAQCAGDADRVPPVGAQRRSHLQLSRHPAQALGDRSQPMGITEYKLLESLPAELQTSLPSIEQIERELAGVAAAPGTNPQTDIKP